MSTLSRLLKMFYFVIMSKSIAMPCHTIARFVQASTTEMFSVKCKTNSIIYISYNNQMKLMHFFK